MPVANVNGVDLHYEVYGQGKAIVFLHGFVGSIADWACQIPVLSPEYRVIAPEHRGHGDSAAPAWEEDYSIPIFADDVLGLLKALGVAKCCLVGHSMGGFISLEVALKHQDMLAALVLVDTSSGHFDMDPEYGSQRHRLEELARTRGMAAAFEYEVNEIPFSVEFYARFPEKKEQFRRKMLLTSADGYIYGFRAIANWPPLTSRLSEIRVPTLIYWGDEDLAFAEAAQVLREGIAGSEMVVAAGVGHAPHEDAPHIFNEALLKFLGGVGW